MFNYQKIIKFSWLDDEFERITEKLEEVKFPNGFLDFLLYSISELFVNLPMLRNILRPKKSLFQ
ncbi:MAG: hypothetical protein QME57_03555 [Patescibacteria group bacterium]|nr:hypothetical protein [Patescibacteria group bacterium]